MKRGLITSLMSAALVTRSLPDMRICFYGKMPKSFLLKMQPLAVFQRSDTPCFLNIQQ